MGTHYWKYIVAQYKLMTLILYSHFSLSIYTYFSGLPWNNMSKLYWELAIWLKVNYNHMNIRRWVCRCFLLSYLSSLTAVTDGNNFIDDKLTGKFWQFYLHNGISLLIRHPYTELWPWLRIDVGGFIPIRLIPISSDICLMRLRWTGGSWLLVMWLVRQTWGSLKIH